MIVKLCGICQPKMGGVVYLCTTFHIQYKKNGGNDCEIMRHMSKQTPPKMGGVVYLCTTFHIQYKKNGLKLRLRP